MLWPRRGIRGEKPLHASELLSRRRLLGAAAAVTAVGLVKPATAVSFAPRSVSLYNVHTGEWLRTVYWADGHYIREAVRDINWILRDHDSGEIRPMNAGVLDVLGLLRDRLDTSDPFLVVCGYRSPDDQRQTVSARQRGRQAQLSHQRNGGRSAQRRTQPGAGARCRAEPPGRRRRLLSASGLCSC